MITVALCAPIAAMSSRAMTRPQTSVTGHAAGSANVKGRADMNNWNPLLEMLAAVVLAFLGYILTVFIMLQGGPH